MQRLHINQKERKKKKENKFIFLNELRDKIKKLHIHIYEKI